MIKKRASDVLDEGTAAEVADFFSAFSDTSRVRIISALMSGRMAVNSIADLVGISESAVSHHLRGLRQLRLVKAHKEGRHVYYYLADDHIVSIFESGINHICHD
jgi:ArsR family transcriptional regulator